MTTTITIAHNEAYILPYFVAHYRQLAERIIVYDNQSNDGTAGLARELGCEVIPYQSHGCDRDDQTRLQNTLADLHREADWLIIVDTDELLYHPNLKELLAEATEQGCSAFRAEGYEMVSEWPLALGIPLTEQVTAGMPCITYTKPAIYAPKLITETNYAMGRHAWKPTGQVRYHPTPLALLHYKFVGGLERVVRKHQEYMERISTPGSANALYQEANTRAYFSWLKTKQREILCEL